ncbi:hypothetical protein MOQ72_42485 [Saccharopolyspora sp. K220]|uniref:hypothetical protein n=1 Tax=Saccharopolyspora soli TaxID=2926618 RepID=UPI001F598132|nr:hypothetical protein [Saccharopolyspora soli]MCI2424087.1 hypothetical protein [Saccharopolyspora soli]
MLPIDRPRVWLAGRDRPSQQPPSSTTWLRDDACRVWVPNGQGSWHTPDNRHHATLHELRGHTDLVEVRR